MKWIAIGAAVMTERGMLEIEQRGQIEADLMLLRQKAVQVWNAEIQARRGGDDEALKLWSEEIQRDEDLRNVFIGLKTAFLV